MKHREDSPQMATYQEPDAKNLRSLKRQIEVGYQRFLARRGLKDHGGMRAAVNAGLAEGKAMKQRKNAEKV